MELSLQKSLEELKDAIAKDPRVIALSELEKKLYEDASLLELVKKKDDIERQYNLVLSYKDKEDEEAKAIEKALYEVKLEIDTYPLAKEYSDAFVKVRDIYMQIDDIIFGKYRVRTLSSKVR